MPNIQEHSNNILRLRKGQNQLFWIMHKLGHGDTCFFIVCMYFFLASQGSGQFKEAVFCSSGLSVRIDRTRTAELLWKRWGPTSDSNCWAKLIILSAHPIHTNTANDWRLAKGKQGTATI